MPDEIDLTKLVSQVDLLKPGAPLDNFIGEVVFPNFKSLTPNSRLTFDFPLTAIVGANGTGKSSILHALWGTPLRRSTSRFWFSTAVDPIEEGGSHGPPRYFYAHYVKPLKRYVQTRKMRISKKKGYWEPARLSTRDGMEAMPALVKAEAPFRSIDRWNAPARNVLYINFKCEFSSFDRFFYFPPRGETAEKRQSAFLSGARKLRRVIDGGLQSFSPGGKQAVFENRDLTSSELSWTSYILGRKYVSAHFVQHRLYGNVESPSIIFNNSGKKYSEAFAGSGELAVARAVIRLLSAKDSTLVLLDEPETSLHPGAQERLLCFLLKMILVKHLQIVMSTHSPTLVGCLPTKAIKVLEELPDGKSVVLTTSHPQVAFNRLGAKVGNKFTVAVEDPLLFALVEMAMKTLDPGEQDAFDLYIPPGGASSILAFEIPLWMQAKRQVYVILDGDQMPGQELPDPDKLSLSEQMSLGSTIKKAFGMEPMHISDGHSEPAASYIRWLKQRLRFLDAVCPEFVLLEGLIGSVDAEARASTNQQAKKGLIAELERRNHRTDAIAISASASFILEAHNPAYSHIIYLVLVLRGFIAHHAATAVVL